MLRKIVMVAAVCLPATHSFAVDCDPDTFIGTCADATTLNFCADTDEAGAPIDPPQEDTFNCTYLDDAGAAQVPGGSCDALPCADDLGDGCTAFGLDAPTCVAANGDPCIGLSPLLDSDSTNDNSALGLMCGTGACVLNDTEEACTGGFSACTPTSEPATCDGNTLVLCLFGASEDDDDSGTINGTEVDEDEDGQVDSFLITMPTAIDCAAFDGTCSLTASDGPLHALAQVASGQAIPDCVLPAEGEGEGEGEGGGEGEGEGDSRDDDESSSESAPLCGSFSHGGTPLMSLFALAGVLAVRRRRR